MESGIYKITNKTNGKFYIGQTVNFMRRSKEHIYATKNKSCVLGRALRKHGKENFEFSIIERCPLNELNAREKHYIDTLCPQYNMNEGGIGNKGFHVSQEVRDILSLKARQQWDNYPDEKKKYIIATRLIGPKPGYTVSEATKKKLRLYTGRPSTDLQRKRASEINKILKIGNCCRQRAVCQVDLKTNSVVAIFPMAKTAAEKTGASRSGITHACKLRQKSCGGFGWKYFYPESVETIPQGSRAISSLEAQSNQAIG